VLRLVRRDGYKMSKKEVEERVHEKEKRFSKEQLLQSPLAQSSRDLLNALLVDGKEYSQKEVADKIEKYRKGKVN